MIDRRTLVAGIVAAATCCTAAEAQRGRPSFCRGVSIDNLVYWGRLRAGDPGHYANEPFAGPEHTLPDALLANVVTAGFDFVRLTVDPGPFLDLEGQAREALDGLLAHTLGRLRRFGLAVMVDLHPNTQVRAYDPVTWLTSVSDPMFARYLALVRHIARLLGDRMDAGIAFELMNEPPYGYDRSSARRWQAMLETLHDAARAQAPDTVLVLSGARGGSAGGLADVDPAPFRGSRVLYAFHYYEPHVFTHQGVPSDGQGTRSWRYMSDLPYPPAEGSRAATLAKVESNVRSDVALDPAARMRALRQAENVAEAYLASDAGPERVATDFDAVLAWAWRGGVEASAILLGEFGVTRTYGPYRAAGAQARADWLRDVRTAAERRGFGWALWELVGSGGMASVTADGAVTLDDGTLRALGLGRTRR
jgi:hypothetical protein